MTFACVPKVPANIKTEQEIDRLILSENIPSHQLLSFISISLLYDMLPQRNSACELRTLGILEDDDFMPTEMDGSFLYLPSPEDW